MTFQMESAKLAKVAEGGDMKAFGAQYKAMAKNACGACHKAFREKKIIPETVFHKGRLVGLTAAILVVAAAPSFADGDIKRGQYLFDAAGCAGCHTDHKNKGALLAGGRKLKTPFGIFSSPNITPYPANGIDGWSDSEFIRALRDGISPDGEHYFPVFPYPSYTGITDQDLTDNKAYIFTLPEAATPNKPHEVSAPFGWRFLLPIWKTLFFSRGPYRSDPAKSREWNRCAYIINALGHCGECHTPRNALGGIKADMALAGPSQGPEGGIIPNITPDKKTGIGR